MEKYSLRYRGSVAPLERKTQDKLLVIGTLFLTFPATASPGNRPVSMNVFDLPGMSFETAALENQKGNSAYLFFSALP